MESADEESPDFERPAAHRWAREQLRELRPVVRRARRTERRARKRVRRARRAQRQARTAARLHELPIQDLARGSGIRARYLADAGIRGAGDLLAAFKKDPDLKVRGVTRESVAKLVDRAHSEARVKPEDLKPPARPEKWVREDFDLVRTLLALSAVVSLIGMPHLAALQQFVTALRLFKWATSWLRWLFSSDARREAVGSQYARIRADRESPQTVGALRQVLDGLSRVGEIEQITLSDADVVREWRKSSATLLALFEEILAEDYTRVERDAVRHSLALDKLAPDLVRRIEEMALDKTLMIRQLRPYQQFGAKFALIAGRCLLGDDMGLGKTIEALAAIGHAVDAEGQRHHVVLCPASLIDTWSRETEQTLRGVNNWAFIDRNRERAFKEWKAGGGILLTTYRQAEHLLSRDLPPIGFVVVDEAHLVKNPSTQSARWAGGLVSRSNRALLMGGTLMENRAGEMIAVARLVDPRKGARLQAEFGDGRDAARDPARFRHELADFYLRRNQDEVLTELPGIIVTDELIAVGEDERLACKRALSEGNLARARMALTVGNDAGSKKLLRLREIIRECRDENRKVLIFTEFRSVLSAVQGLIGNGCHVIHGDVPVAARSDVTALFQQMPGFAALALQINIGGVGLNLQAASVVVLMEPQYKPSTEWQAVARAHRMGQTARVIVYRLIAKDSVDERIVELTDFKADLFDKLARHSVLAETSLAVRDRRVDVSQLLTEERRRFGLS